MRSRVVLACSFTLAAAFGFARPALSQVLFFDDFEGGTSASNYTVVADTRDFRGLGVDDKQDFAFAYTDLGIVGDVRSGTGAQFITQDAFTAFVNGITLDGSERVSITYDLYANPESSGSTEYASVGVGSGQLPFEHYLSSASVGNELTDGVFAVGSTDSDTSGAGDYMIIEGDGTLGSPTDLYDGDAAGNAQDGTDFSLILPGGDAGPSGEAATPAILAHRWVSVQLVVDGDQVTYRFDGATVATVTASAPVMGSVGFGIVDPFPSTNQSARLTPPFSDTNIIIDNVMIEVIPEPATFALASLALAGFAGVRRRR